MGRVALCALAAKGAGQVQVGVIDQLAKRRRGRDHASCAGR